jgi:hypothetical protein
VDRLGSYTRGERKFATSAVDNERQVSVNPDQEVIDLNSDDNDVQMVDPPAKKQRIVDDNSLWADLPLLPDPGLDGLDDISSADIESDGDSEISVANV